ncbi:pseudaminic acid cytidylyltransferase [Gallaecimonas sp. GXIMD4217]|uniref:pseudaminic acid cytidylyltransferase n=1 Tax=Gallaecimonas sp. GXIMD4217 TaxID=3131927 RepID=UPI00311B093D
MKIAVIPARGGSKRIPRKNLRPFCGKPIMAYAIEAALASGCFDLVLVSTDDQEMAAVARAWGAETPFVRPAALADDVTGTNAVAAHAIDWFQQQGQQVTAACCLYATAPFLTPDIIRAGDRLLSQAPDAGFVVTVTEFEFPIQRAVGIADNGRLALREPQHLKSRSQDLTPFYHDAGQLYWGRSAAFLEDWPLFGDRTVPLLLPRERVQDIDTDADWRRAELMYQVWRRQLEQGDQ